MLDVSESETTPESCDPGSWATGPGRKHEDSQEGVTTRTRRVLPRADAPSDRAR